MNPDLITIQSLRRVLESAGVGEGLARSIVKELKDAGLPESQPARLLLLGYPLHISLMSMIENRSEEVSMLASMIVSGPLSSALVVGRSGGVLSLILERWVKTRVNAVLEQKVLRFRSLVTSAVMGAVMATIASLGPLVANLGLGGQVVTTASLLLAAAAMTIVGSGMLGFYMSGRKFFVNILVSLLVFGLVAGIASPLVSIPSVSLGGQG